MRDGSPSYLMHKHYSLSLPTLEARSLLSSLHRMEGRDKEEAPGPGGKAVSLRRSARVASNRSAASSVSLSVEGGDGSQVVHIDSKLMASTGKHDAMVVIV